jgi:CubicO group peptidase (beta-lactamase class C family)
LSKQLEINIKPLVLTSQKMQQTAKRRLMFESSLSLVMNQDQSVPFANLSDKKIFVFDGRQHLKSDASLKDVVSFHYSSAKWYETFDVNLIDSYVDKVFCCVVLIDDKDLLPQVALSCWKLKSRYPNAQIHLLLNCDNLSEGIVDNDYKCFSSASIGYENNEFIWISSLQGLFGGISLNGKCLFNLKGLSEKNENLNTKKCRVKLGFPEEVGMSTDSLNMISDIMNDAIQNHATPGGQIIVARDGVVVFRKAFGKKTYKTDEPVDIKDLYDIASVTKIMSTTPILMHLAENGLIDSTQPLSKYLPETDTTNKGHLLIYEIMRHKAGLQSMIPTFYNYIDRTGLGENVFSRKYSSAYPYKIDDRLYLNKDANLRQDVFKSSPDSLFSVCVAKDMYMNRQFTDSIYRSILLSKVDTFKIYRYSDMGFCLLQHLVEKVKKQTINRLVDSLIYQPLGLDRITYLPLTRFDEKQLVPTENDAYFRKQLLRGYVHDPGAALMGGVAGNAGVFACADDLCKMMQMYMNNGEYGNVQLFKPETVQKFVRQYSTDSRRGLGFDKPETDIHKLSPVCTEASASSFGHNGFTGTLVWADPETKLVFIFLSNRINPDVTNKKLVSGNTRSLAMEAAYQAIFAPAPSHQQ